VPRVIQSVWALRPPPFEVFAQTDAAFQSRAAVAQGCTWNTPGILRLQFSPLFQGSVAKMMIAFGTSGHGWPGCALAAL